MFSYVENPIKGYLNGQRIAIVISLAYDDPYILESLAKFLTVFSTRAGQHVQLDQRLEGGELRSKPDECFARIIKANALCKSQPQDGRSDAVAGFATANGSRLQGWRTPVRHLQGCSCSHMDAVIWVLALLSGAEDRRTVHFRNIRRQPESTSSPGAIGCLSVL